MMAGIILDWYALSLPTAALGAAVLMLDEYPVGQVAIARPLLIASLVGLFCGNLATALFLGALFELVALETSPVGATIPANAAAGSVVATLLASGPSEIVPALAFPAGIVASWAFPKLDYALRGRRDIFEPAARAQLKRGEDVDWFALHAKSVGSYVAACFLFLYFVVGVAGPVLSWGWAFLPTFGQAAMEFAFRLAPLLILGVVVQAVSNRVWVRS